MDKLSYEVFSILENKFLLSSPIENKKRKVRILSIDSSSDAGGDDEHLLAAVSLARLESSLRSNSHNPDAHIVDFFDVAAGSGLGGVLAAMLFTRGPDGKPLFSAEESLRFLSDNRLRLRSNQTSPYLRRILRRRRPSKGTLFRKMFHGALTLRDTLKPVLIPCYDLSTGAPFLFSRADAMETDAYDFNLDQICAATCADRRPVEMASVDGRTKIVALGGGVAMSNPAAAAITHVLNNKQEFPSAASVDDLLVLSICSTGGSAKLDDKLSVAANAGADTVDQAVATAFVDSFMSDNYVRIQTNLCYRNIESTLFRGRRVSEQTNADKLEEFGGKLIEEQKRRILSTVPTQAMSPRTSSSSAATSTTSTSIATLTDDSCC